MYEKNGEMDNVSGRLCRKVDDAYEAFIYEHYGMKKTQVTETDDASGITFYEGEEHIGFFLVAVNKEKPELRIVTNGLGTMTTLFAMMDEVWRNVGEGILVDNYEFVGEHGRKWQRIVLKTKK